MGVFDEQDLRFRTQELVEFVRAASDRYGFGSESVVAVGYSNGANIAASMLLLYPQVLRGAVLFSPMAPLRPEKLANLRDVPVFVAAGREDPIVPGGNTKQLLSMLKQAEADVTEYWHQGGHELSQTAVEAARQWISQLFERFSQDDSKKGP
jgi:phospholipase/carboxylesterase/glyoxalase family protein